MENMKLKFILVIINIKIVHNLSQWQPKCGRKIVYKTYALEFYQAPLDK